jgi:hypothetical protein
VTAPTLAVLGPELTATTWSLVAATLLVLTVVTVLCVLRARRLDRLHRRTDAARAGLADALERRGRVALRVASVLDERAPPAHGDLWSSNGAPRQPSVSMRRGGGSAAGVRAAAHDALTACRAGLRAAGADLEPCEVAENTLTRMLATVDRGALPAGLAGELLDTEQLTLLARRVHNDAVRDTLDLRSRRLVRWLRLAGTAPAPAYFEIADPPRRDPAPRPPEPAAGTATPAVTGTGVPG